MTQFCIEEALMARVAFEERREPSEDGLDNPSAASGDPAHEAALAQMRAFARGE